jgi:aquaporin rerated protein, other eukaryote
MIMTKTITYTRGFLLVSAQIVGAIIASYIVQALFPSEFNVRTTLAAETSVARGLIIEAILTAELVFTVFMLAKEKHKATYMAPIGIGLALFVAELVGVFFTGGSLNPARSLGPCVATGQFDNEHWIYCKLTQISNVLISNSLLITGVGPAIGAVAAFLFYKFIKILEYEMANPGQDLSLAEAKAAGLHDDKERGEEV